jgi:hypothetical protein
VSAVSSTRVCPCASAPLSGSDRPQGGQCFASLNSIVVRLKERFCGGNLKTRETLSQPRSSRQKSNSMGGWHRSIGNLTHTNKVPRINILNSVWHFLLSGICCHGMQMPQTSYHDSVGNGFESVHPLAASFGGL